MALHKRVYGVKTSILPRIFSVHGILAIIAKVKNPLRPNQKFATSEDFS